MFGGNVFGWTLDESASFRMLDILYERGYRFIDTADSYGKTTGLSESIIGKWMHHKGNRHEITLATKGGNVHTKMPDGKIKRSRNNAPEYLTGCINRSLTRLQTDYIDLYYTHFDDEKTPIKDVLATYDPFIKAGKIKAIGASNFSKERLSEALTTANRFKLPSYVIFQAEYNLVERREFEKEYRKIALENNLTIASYFSLASGFLTGKYQTNEDFEGTARQGLTQKYFNPQGKEILQTLGEVAEEYNTSQAAVALAWILHQPGISFVLASATKEKHIDAFDQALELKFSLETLAKLNQVSQEP